MTSVNAVCAAALGLAFLASGVFVRSRSGPRVPTLLLLAVGLTTVAAAAVFPFAPQASERIVLVGASVLFATLIALYPDGRGAPELGAVGTAVVVGVGVLAATAPTDDLSSVYELAQVVLLIGLLWWRFEKSADRERRALLWLALVLGGGLLLAGHIGFLSPNSDVGAVLAVTALLPVPLGLAVGLVNPYVLDVRAVMTRAVVEATSVLSVVALFVGLTSVFELATGRSPSVGALGFVAAACGLVYAPLREVLLGTIDRLLFGEREDPVSAASHVGRTLEDPVLALRALREALALPYAALYAEAELVASSGSAASGVHQRELLLGQRCVGRLEVGLRPGDLRLSARDLVVLDVVAPALAQTLRALALTQQLHTSRARVIGAVEEERRRLRHDLHDTVGPTLTGIAYTADAARNSVVDDPAGAHRLLVGLRADTATAIEDVRRVVEGLRPPAVDELGLVGALRQQVVSLHGADGRAVSVMLSAEEPLTPLPAAVEVAAYRIVLEALANVCRHAACDEASVQLWREGRRLAVEVRDNGNCRAPWVPGVGLTSMRERSEQLGGSFTVEAGAHGGTVRAEFPLG